MIQRIIVASVKSSPGMSAKDESNVLRREIDWQKFFEETMVSIYLNKNEEWKVNRVRASRMRKLPLFGSGHKDVDRTHALSFKHFNKCCSGFVPMEE